MHTVPVFLFTILPLSIYGLSILGQQSCPSKDYKNIQILWTEYTSSYLHEDSNGTLSGIFPRIWKESLAQCCPRLNYTWHKLNGKDTLRKQARAIDAIGTAKDDIVVIFPMLKTLGDTTANDLTIFKFIPIKVSPGPMLLTNTKSIEMRSYRDFRFLLPMWVNPVFYLILAMAASSGVIFWVTVCIITHTSKKRE